jgi:signal peptidase I
MSDPHPPSTALDDHVTSLDGEGADEAATPVPAKKRRRGNALTEWLIVLAVAVGAALIVRQFVLQQFAVSGESMEYTLHDGDRVLVNKLSYRLHDPRRGDVVVLKSLQGTSERDLIKRVVGLPGETVEWHDCSLFIDGREVVEPYLDQPLIHEGTTPCGPDQAKITVPDGSVFVMGDHRNNSMDSRNLGPIKDSLIVGRAFVVVWPSSDWRWL